MSIQKPELSAQDSLYQYPAAHIRPGWPKPNALLSGKKRFNDLPESLALLTCVFRYPFSRQPLIRYVGSLSSPKGTRLKASTHLRETVMDVSITLLRTAVAAIDGQQTGLVSDGQAFDVAQEIDRLLSVHDREWRAEYHAKHTALDEAKEALDELEGNENDRHEAEAKVEMREAAVREWLEEAITEACETRH